MISETMVSENQASVSDVSDGTAAAAKTNPLSGPLGGAGQEPVVLGGVILKGKIGEGGMAGVHLGWHTRLKVPVAVKILKEPSPANLPMFLREARLTVSVDHPNLVRVFDVNVEPHSGLHYIVMEYVDGCSAYQLLERQLAQHHRPLTQVTALEIALCTARALGAAHRQGIVHRDVKSDNILVRSKDGAVKLTDLGFAGQWREPDGAGVPRRSAVAGTLGFISPELLGGEQATPAADVYALGATLYELLTGRLPYGVPYDDTYYIRQLAGPPRNVRELTPAIHEDVAALVQRCMERRPEHRYADGDEVAAALEKALRKVGGTRVLAAISEETADPADRPVVLCVDDDAAVLELMRDILEAQGFQPVCFTDAVEALSSVGHIKPDVAILDMNMPQVSGVQLCQGLRQVDGFQELAVLIVSGSDEPRTIHDALERGITDYLVKPVSGEELVVRVRLLTKLRAMHQERRVIETQLLRLKNAHRSSTAAACISGGQEAKSA